MHQNFVPRIFLRQFDELIKNTYVIKIPKFEETGGSRGFENSILANLANFYSAVGTSASTWAIQASDKIKSGRVEEWTAKTDQVMLQKM